MPARSEQLVEHPVDLPKVVLDPGLGEDRVLGRAELELESRIPLLTRSNRGSLAASGYLTAILENR